MKVAILTFDGFNEIDSFVALGLVSHLRPDGWTAQITAPSTQVTSMNGVTVTAQQPLEFANEADAVIFGSGIYTRAIAENSAILDRLQLDPLRQLIGGQCSGTLLMARLGLLGTMPACTDPTTKPWVVQAGVLVLDEPFHARGPIATAGGCMSSVYLASWVIAKRAGIEAAQNALRAIAPVARKDDYAEQALAVVRPFLDRPGVDESTAAEEPPAG
jgi:transcriptional regulator GlxA family with amidase domain